MQNKITQNKIIIHGKSIKSQRFDDFYFNTKDGVGESSYVFLLSNQLKKRFSYSKGFIIGELGFGTGLNFLLTLDLWIKYGAKNSTLNYISFEKYPLSNEQLKKILANFREVRKLSKLLISNLPLMHSGIHNIDFDELRVKLTLVYEDFKYVQKLNFLADVWYLDGFSPMKNKRAWSRPLLKLVYNNTKLNGTFSTFTSSSFVQRNLKEAGFKIYKEKGFLKKREMISGIKIKKTINISFNHNNLSKELEPIAIIGSGVSGCSIAYSLNKRNIDCFIIDKSKTIGNGASGNLLALQLPRLTLDNSTLGIFSLRSFLYSRKLAQKLGACPKTDGVVVFPSRERELSKFKKLINYNYDKKLFQKHEGLFNEYYDISHIYPGGGIVDNKKFLKILMKNVQFIDDFEVTEIKNLKGEKLIVDINGKSVRAKSVIWANGHDMKNILRNKLIIPTSGYVSYLKSNKLSENLKLNFSYGNFFSQPFQGYHQIGSAFYRTKQDLNNINYKENFEKIPNFIKNNYNFVQKDINYSRFGIRATTKNKLPFFGNLDDFKEFFFGGMGSWGFIYAPFLAEILVQYMLKENLCVEDFILNSLNIENRI